MVARRRYPLILLVILVSLLAAGCTCTDHDHDGFGPKCKADDDSSNSTTTVTGGVAGTSGSTAQGLLHVADANGSLFRFENVSTVDGNTASTTPVQGNLTQLVSPRFLALDSTNDRLFVADSGANAILIFDNASTLVANAPPARVLTGAATQLNTPTQVILDSVNNELFVCNSGGSNILSFGSADTLDGATAPIRRLGGNNSNLNAPAGMFYDSGNNRLVVANGASILFFDNFRGQNGDPFPNRILSGSNTRLSNAVYPLLDTSGNLFVSDPGTVAILRFASASTVEGNVVPAAVVEGVTTRISAPGQMALDGAGGLYLADGNSILHFTGIATANGAPTPNRDITGANTNLVGAGGLALDNSR